MIYTSADYAIAMLEKLVHGSGRLPPGQHFIEITLSVGLSYETVNLPDLPGWDLPDGSVSKPYGQAWLHVGRSLLLIVPSLVARVADNILINPNHPELRHVSHTRHVPVWWDERLLLAAAPPPASSGGASVLPPGTRKRRTRKEHPAGRTPS